MCNFYFTIEFKHTHLYLKTANIIEVCRIYEIVFIESNKKYYLHGILLTKCIGVIKK